MNIAARYLSGEHIICECGHELGSHNNADHCMGVGCLCKCFAEIEEEK